MPEPSDSLASKSPTPPTANMGLTPEERTRIVAAVDETAMAINDRVNATTAQQRQAAYERYKAGMFALLIAFANVLKHGTQGDYQ